MKKPLRCFLGVHKYKYTKAVYSNLISKMLATMPISEASRVCICCGKKQKEDRQLLGLYPPEYLETWYTINE